ncbi:type II toxin-antitoxin system RelE/ParE family toxin [Rhodoferax sp.]|uniref:type II toxin-antitoxin system RelE/ParE family toxin n=1 Tax=Rhodoferax sp. TaxID=50421 RepID=UPI00274820DB|nr:type II toxin-antitoxin system RelE/ParE family toxin [Rhodoferax sp.]
MPTAALEKSRTANMPLIGSPFVDRKGLRKLVIDFGDTDYTALYSLSEKTDTLRVLAIKHQKENDYK